MPTIEIEEDNWKQIMKKCSGKSNAVEITNSIIRDQFETINSVNDISIGIPSDLYKNLQKRKPAGYAFEDYLKDICEAYWKSEDERECKLMVTENPLLKNITRQVHS